VHKLSDEIAPGTLGSILKQAKLGKQKAKNEKVFSSI
jgi:hypothetical protein